MKAIPRPLPPNEPFASRTIKRLELTNAGSKFTIVPFRLSDLVFLKTAKQYSLNSSGLLKSSFFTGRNNSAIFISPRAINQVEKEFLGP